MHLRATFLSAATVLAIALWGMAVYTDGAISGQVPADGYGVSTASAVSAL